MEQVDVWNVVVQVALIIVALFGGGHTVVEVVKRLKELLGTHGFWTQLLAATVSLVLGLATLIAEGAITQQTFALDNLSVWVLGIFFASQVVYSRLVDEGVIEQTRSSP